jgi:hypothetical protein
MLVLRRLPRMASRTFRVSTEKGPGAPLGPFFFRCLGGEPSPRRNRSVVGLSCVGGFSMLQRLGDHISACLERADKCREAAASANDDHVRRQLLDLEQQWQQVAKTYEFVASLERFLLDQQNHTLPREAEKLPSPRNKGLRGAGATDEHLKEPHVAVVVGRSQTVGGHAQTPRSPARPV